MTGRTRVGVCVMCVLCVAGVDSGYAQDAKPSHPLAIGSLRISGSLRLRAEGWGWFDTPAAEPSYGYFASLLRIDFSQEKARWSWHVEIAQPLLLGLPKNSIAPAPQGQLGLGATYFASNGSWAANAFPKQAFVRFKGLFGDKPSSMRLGRFEFVDGTEMAPKNATLAALTRDRIAHRLIGNFAFSHVQRSFDGAQYTRATAASNVTLVGARPTRGVFQVDGWGELDTDIFYGAFTRLVGNSRTGEWRAFVLSYHDGRNLLKTDSRPQAVRNLDRNNIRITSWGGDYVQTATLGAGTADLLLWGAWQSGHWGVLEQHAGALAAEGGYQPPWKLKPWFRAGYLRGSGDDNPNDNRHGTFFPVLPTPRVYARFPFYNTMNSADTFGEIILRPDARWTVRADAHVLQLSNSRDLWYSGGGAYQPSTFGFTGRPSNGSSSLANVYDVSVDFQLTPQVTLTGYLAAAGGKTVVSKIYPTGAEAKMGYLEMLWKF